MRNPPASASPWSPEEEDTVSVVRKPDTCQTLVFKSSEETNCHTSCITACGSALSAGPTKDWFEVEKCDTQMQLFVPCRQRDLQVFLSQGFQGSLLSQGRAEAEHQPFLQRGLRLQRRKIDNRTKTTG